jgi:hypothetical protein
MHSHIASASIPLHLYRDKKMAVIIWKIPCDECGQLQWLPYQKKYKRRIYRASDDRRKPDGGWAHAPNLTPESSSRIFGWTEQIFMNRFRMGKVYPDSEMPWNFFKRMDDIELKAIYKFFRTIQPVKTVNTKS